MFISKRKFIKQTEENQKMKNRINELETILCPIMHDWVQISMDYYPVDCWYSVDVELVTTYKCSKCHKIKTVYGHK